MTQSDKELLLRDLCCRFPYGVIVKVYDTEHGDFDSYIENISRTCVETHAIKDLDYNPYVFYKLEDIKPYLRPISSMTDEEKALYEGLMIGVDNVSYMLDVIDWLNAHHFDYRGLIEKGLALKAPEEMYNIKD